MISMKPQNSTSWAGILTNEIVLLYFLNVNKHKILLLSFKGSIKTKKGLI